MNFATAQVRHDNSSPPSNDTSASERSDAFLADQVRISLDPIYRRIVAIIERDSVDPQTKVQFRSVELQNQLIVRAAAIKAKRRDGYAKWDEATNEAMLLDRPVKFAILDLIDSGADDCQVGRLFASITRQAFAEACVSMAEDEIG